MFDAILEMGLSIFQFVFNLFNQIELREGVTVWSFFLVTLIGMALIKLLLSMGSSLGSSTSSALNKAQSMDKKKNSPSVSKNK